MGIIGFFTYHAYHGDYNPTYDYTPQGQANTTFVLGFVGYKEQIIIHMDSWVHLHTKSLSALSPISVDAKVYESVTQKISPELWKALPDNLFLVFPYALVLPLQQNPYGDYLGEQILFTKNKNSTLHEYDANGTMEYQFEGRYGYLIVPESTEKNNLVSSGIDIYNSTEMDRKIPDYEKFPIGSTDRTTSLMTNSITLTLTLMLIGFGVFELRNAIRDGIIWLYEIVVLPRYMRIKHRIMPP